MMMKEEHLIPTTPPTAAAVVADSAIEEKEKQQPSAAAMIDEDAVMPFSTTATLNTSTAAFRAGEGEGGGMPSPHGGGGPEHQTPPRRAAPAQEHHYRDEVTTDEDFRSPSTGGGGGTNNSSGRGGIGTLENGAAPQMIPHRPVTPAQPHRRVVGGRVGLSSIGAGPAGPAGPAAVDDGVPVVEVAGPAPPSQRVNYQYKTKQTKESARKARGHKEPADAYFERIHLYDVLHDFSHDLVEVRPLDVLEFMMSWSHNKIHFNDFPKEMHATAHVNAGLPVFLIHDT